MNPLNEARKDLCRSLKILGLKEDEAEDLRQRIENLMLHLINQHEDMAHDTPSQSF